MKQESFFTDVEVCKFTQTEKLNRIFELLVTYLQVTETKCKKYPLKRSNYLNMKGEIYQYPYTIFFNSYNFDNVNNCISPFSDIKIDICKEYITIIGDYFDYTFALDQILTIYNRFKKIKEL